MKFYLILFIIILSLCLLRMLFSRNSKIGFFISGLVTLILILVSGLRYNVGTDYTNYIIMYNRIGNGIFQQGLEPGYSLLNLLINKLGLGSQWVFIISSSIIGIAVFKLVEKKSPNPGLSMFMYFSINILYISLNFNLVRQGIAVGFLIFSLKYIEDKKIWKYIFLILVGSMFHYTILFFMPLYFVLNKNLTNKLMLSISSIIYFMSISGISGKVVNLLYGIFGKYSSYLDSSFSRSTDANSFFMLTIVFFISIMYIFFNKYFIGKDKIYYIMGYLAIIFQMFFASSLIMMRASSYLVIIIIVILPMILDKFEGVPKAFLIVPCVLVFSIMYFKFINYSLSGITNIVPYGTIFGK